MLTVASKKKLDNAPEEKVLLLLYIGVPYLIHASAIIEKGEDPTVRGVRPASKDLMIELLPPTKSSSSAHCCVYSTFSRTYSSGRVRKVRGMVFSPYYPSQCRHGWIHIHTYMQHMQCCVLYWIKIFLPKHAAATGACRSTTLGIIEPLLIVAPIHQAIVPERRTTPTHEGRSRAYLGGRIYYHRCVRCICMDATCTRPSPLRAIYRQPESKRVCTGLYARTVSCITIRRIESRHRENKY